MKKYIITEEEYEALKAKAKKNKNKKIDKRLQIPILRYEGLKDGEIAEKLGFNRKYISQCCAEFKQEGLEEYCRIKCTSNYRKMSNEQEKEILNTFRQKSEQGQIISVQEIKEKFDEYLGYETQGSYIYKVLKRNGWRKVMPRSEHPKKANEEEIASSKKLNQLSNK